MLSYKPSKTNNDGAKIVDDEGPAKNDFFFFMGGILQDFVPSGYLLGRCPAYIAATIRKIPEQGKSTDDHLLPLLLPMIFTLISPFK